MHDYTHSKSLFPLLYFMDKYEKIFEIYCLKSTHLVLKKKEGLKEAFFFFIGFHL